MKTLEVSNLGKAFSNYGAQWRRVLSWYGLPFKPLEELWALRAVSFTMTGGEAVGIVGVNGAGKSTLLKLIAGTLYPTQGRIWYSGRLAAILELGMGFNPEFTGRENAYHGLGLMGFSHEDIVRILPQVEVFSEIGDYFDEPLRTYSTGMHMRVAFSVATAQRPEFLIVDEALSVGDAYFQHKSFKRVREFQGQGTTLLIASHDRNTILSLCDRALLLEGGTLVKDGRPEEVMDYYNALIAEKEDSTVRVASIEDGKKQTTSGTGEARVDKIGLFNVQGKQVELVGVGDPVELRVQVIVHHPIATLVLGYMINDHLGRTMYGTNTWHTQQIIRDVREGDQLEYSIRFPANLGPGSYSISTALTSTDTHLVNNYEWRDLALVFRVANPTQTYFVGCSWIEPQITIQRL